MDAIRSFFFDFKKTCDLLYDKFLFQKNWTQTYQFIPYVVNGTFCIEIGFKALLNKKKVNKIHSLIKLFNLLDEIDQNYLINKICSYGNTVSESKSEIIEYLQIIDLNFIEWRYYYEYDEVRTNWLFIHDMIEAISSRFTADFTEYLINNKHK